MANQYNAGTHAKIQTAITALSAAIATDFDFKRSAGFKITLEVNADGQSVAVTSNQSDQGQNNTFGPADAAGNLTRRPAKIIPAGSLP